MRLINVEFGTSPTIVHAPGKKDFNPLWPKVLEFYSNDIPEIKSSNVKAITCSSNSISYDIHQSHKIPMIFYDSAKKYGLDVSLLLSKNWKTNRIKIYKTIEYLESEKEEFILGSDCHDSIVLSSNIHFDALYEYKCDMLFCAETNFWPENMAAERIIQRSLCKSRFCYLNGGCWFGRRKTCLEFFNRALKMSNIIKDHPYSEQVCLHRPYIDMHGTVKLDSKCMIFQVINRLTSVDLILEDTN